MSVSYVCPRAKIRFKKLLLQLTIKSRLCDMTMVCYVVCIGVFIAQQQLLRVDKEQLGL